MLWCVGYPPTSKRQIFGRQAEGNARIVGAGRTEVEREVRIDRVGVAKLTLQCSRREQSPCAARREQQGYRLGAKIDGKSPVAARFGLGGDVGNVTAPGLGHRLDACRAHDQASRIDFGGGLRNLDLRALEIAEFGTVVSRGAMSRDLDIVVQTGLCVSQGDAG